MLYSLILRYVGIFMLKIYFKIATQIKDSSLLSLAYCTKWFKLKLFNSYDKLEKAFHSRYIHNS